jgi:hypothetical protein
MPRLEAHCQESLLLFGKEFSEIHQWLDEYAGTPEYGYRHRHKRHHLAGVTEVLQIFGEKAVLAAWQHVISDLKEEGWTESDPFPRDERHYKQMGLF